MVLKSLINFFVWIIYAIVYIVFLTAGSYRLQIDLSQIRN